jgi:PleD family two-component response regulator
MMATPSGRDKVLIIAGDIQGLRKTDFIARFGGEEFVLFYPSCR